MNHPGALKDRGEYLVRILACLENERQLKVPAHIIESFKGKEPELEDVPVMKIPPYLQAIYVEEVVLCEQIKLLKSSPSTERSLDVFFLQERLQALTALRRMLLTEIFPSNRLSKKEKNVYVDEAWNVYLEKTQAS